MRALQVHEATGPSGVAVAAVPEPDGDGQLVVDVWAAGLGFADLLMTRGEHQIRQQLPFTLGWEASGVVSHAPAGSDFASGDEVVTLTLGAFAERIAAVPETTFRLPAGLSLVQGAAFPMNYLTALAALQLRGRLSSGETVLVHGAAGGVGTASIQVARGLGAHVIALVSTAEKAQIALEVGAHEVILMSEDWRHQVGEVAPDGVDVIVDPVGGDLMIDNLRCIAVEGRIVVVGFAGGSIPQIPANRLLLKNADVCGSSWNALLAAPGGLSAAAEQLGELVATGAIRPKISSEVPLEEAPSALHALEKRRVVGKTVFLVDPEAAARETSSHPT